MRISESKIRRIISQEAKRIMREGAFPEEVEAVYGKQPPEMEDEFSSFGSHSYEEEEDEEEDESSADPIGLVNDCMSEIMRSFQDGGDMHDASSMINDLCENLRNKMHKWAEKRMHNYHTEHGEHLRDMAEDR